MKWVILSILAGVGIWFFLNRPTRTSSPTPVPEISSVPSPTTKPAELLTPLDRAGERVTKKPFGIFITPESSPVTPERFRGYHTAADFETFPDEQNSEVRVRAICSGPLKVKERASGYGGVAVQACVINGSPVTVIYGHVKLSSVTGTNFSAGEVIAVLGKGFSTETDGERKHLHLGIHKGDSVNIRGYVSSQSDLSAWLDPCLYFCHD